MAVDITGITGTTDIDDSVVTEYDTEFLSGFTDNRPLDVAVSLAKQVEGGTWQIPVYDPLTVNTANLKLNEKTDPDAVTINDSKFDATPEELGMFVARTQLARLQTRGMIDRAAAQLVGIHAGQSQTRLICEAADLADEAHTVRPSGVASRSAIAAGNIMDTETLRTAFNRIASLSVPVLPGVGTYLLVVHQDVADDLKKDVTAGGFIDTVKYTNPTDILRNEIGMLAGFRIIVNNNITLRADAGASNVDVYTSYIFGYNGMALAQSMPVTMKMAPPIDAFQRWFRLGWYSVQQYKIAQADALWKIETSSSFGDNT